MISRILIVGAKAAFRERLVQHRGYQVDAAENCHAAWERVRGAEYDLLLIDLRVPGAEALELIERLYRSYPGLPQVVISGIEQRQAAVEAMRAGAYDVLWEPMEDLAELEFAVSRGLERGRLVRKRARYDSLLQNLPGIVFWGTIKFRIDLIAGRVQEITGYAPEAFTEGGLKWDEIIHPPDLAKIFPQVRQCMMRGEPARVRFRFQQPDGALRWVECILVFALDAAGQAQSVSGIALDIAERVRAESQRDAVQSQRDAVLEALRESKELFEKVFLSMRDAILLLDAEFLPRIVDCNPATSEIFGYSRQEMLGRTTAFLHVDETTLQKFREFLYPAITEHGFARLPEFEMKRKDGTVFATEHSVMLLQDERDQHTGWVSVVRDVTERVQTETVLRQYLQEQETLFVIGQLVSSSLQIDEVLQRVAEQMTRLVDAASCAISDWDPQTSTLTVQAEYIRPDMVDPDDPVDDMGQACDVSDYPATAAALRNRESFIVYLDDPEADLRERHLLELYQWRGVAGIPLVVQDRVIGLAEVYLAESGQSFGPHDLRLLQSLANQVAVAIDNARLFSATQANEAAMRDLSLRLINVQEQERRYIAQELHDELGQVLTATMINIDLARRKLARQVERQGIDDIAPVQSHLDEAGALTDEVLTKVRAMTVELRPTLLDDMGIVPTLRWYLGRFAQRTGLQVQLEAAELPARLRAEIETTIYRVVQEALTNAARYAQARQVQVQLACSGDMVTASVQDDGQGFDVRVWSERPGEQQTLGLMGIQERAMLLDGRARITSQPGGGTRVEIELPAHFRVEDENGDTTSFVG